MFRFTPDEQRMVGKLGKYLNDIGGLCIFFAVLSVLLVMFTAVGTFVTVGGAGSSIMIAMGIQLAQHAVNIVFLAGIGIWMRRSGAPFRQAAGTSEGHMASVMQSMFGLRKLYSWGIVYICVGFVFAIALTAVNSF